MTFDEGNAESLPGIPISKVPVGHTFFSRYLALLHAVVREAKNIDVIYAQDPLTCGPVCRIVSMLFRKPYFCKFVGDIVWESLFQQGYSRDLEDFLKCKKGIKAGLKFLIEKLVLRAAARVIVPSSYLKRLLVGYYGLMESKVIVVPNAVEIPADGVERNRSEILVVGRIVKTKRIDTILRALALLKSRYALQIRIVGTGPEIDGLMSLAKTLGLDKHVIFAGRVGQDELYRLMKRASMLVLNSNYEGLSHTILEAMACGLPVIASDIEPNAAVIKHGINGLLIRNTPESIAEAILWVIENEQGTDDIIRRARSDILDNYQWDKLIVKLESTLGAR